MATQLIDLGNLRFIWKGDHVQANTYELNDVVRYNNIVWVYINPIPAANILITNATYWSRMVEGSEIPPTEGQGGKVLKTDGTLTFWSDSFDTFLIGADITDFITAATLTDVALGIEGNSTSFVQTALVNTGSGVSSSADFIAYASNGTNESGWIDMGITNQSFNDPTFSLTGPGDGYIFMSGAIAGVVDVDQYSVAGTSLNVISDGPHGMIAGVIFDLVLPVAPTLEGRYTVVSAPSPTQVVVTTPAGYTGGNVALTSVINSQMNKFTGDGNLVLATDSTGLSNNVIIAAGGLQSGTEQIVVTANNGIDVTGDIRIAGNTSLTETIYVGSGAVAFEDSADLTNPGAVFKLNGEPYAQLAIQNSSSNSSTDIIAYANNGVDEAGWIDMGITGSTFSQATYGITGPNDGYIFMEAPEGTTGAGNLVIATGANGSENKIVFAAGGYDSGNEQMSITPDQNVHIEIQTASTSATTGALTVVGGVGISGDVNIAGDITFGGSGTTLSTTTLSVNDPIVFIGDGNITDTVDLGLVGEYTSGGTTKYTGIVRDATDGVVKFYKDTTVAPASGVVNFSGAGLAYTDVRVGAVTSGAVTASGLITANAGVTVTGTVGITGGLTATGGVSLSGTVDVQELREQVVDTILSSNSGTLDWTQGNIFYIANAPTSNMTLNVTNVPTDTSKMMTVTVMVTQGSTGYAPTTFQINGTSNSVRWLDGAAPTGTSSAGKIDFFTFTMFRSGSSWIVFGSTTANF
jgi:hypothetical protein